MWRASKQTRASSSDACPPCGCAIDMAFFLFFLGLCFDLHFFFFFLIEIDVHSRESLVYVHNGFDLLLVAKS